MSVSPALPGGELDRGGLVGHVDVLARAPLPVGQLAQPLADELLGLLDQGIRNRLDRLHAVVVVDAREALLRHVVGGQLRLEVQGGHAGIADHVQEGLDHVLAHLAALHDLEALGLEALLVVVVGVRREAAGIHRADVRDVHEVGHEAGELPAVVDRGDHVDVRRVEGGRVGVVEEVDVVFVDPGVFGEARDDVLDRLGGAREVVEEADASDHQAAVREVQRRHHVVALVRDRRAGYVLERDDRLVGHLHELVPDDLEGDRVDRGVPARHVRSHCASPRVAWGHTRPYRPGTSRPPVPRTSARICSTSMSVSVSKICSPSSGLASAGAPQ